MARAVLFVLLGVWLALGTGMAAVATTNFRTVDRILAHEYRPELATRLAPRSAAEERPILRYLASELNRVFFRRSAVVQLGLAVLAVWLVWRDCGLGRGARGCVLAAAGLTLVLSILLTPAILRLGPPLDFVPRPFPPEWADAGRRFFRLHALYMALDLVKMLLVVALLTLCLRAASRSAAG